MTALLSLYAVTVVAATLSAAMLALLGAQIASREQSVQCMVVSQGASLGIVMALAVGMAAELNSHLLESTTLAGGFVIAALIMTITEKRLSPQVPARNSAYMALFALLMALTYFATVLSPRLESHMATLYFGDLAVLSQTRSYALALVSAIVISILLKRWRTLTDQSFQINLWGHTEPRPHARRLYSLISLLIIFILTLSVLTTGLLFTIGCLFLPTVIIRREAKPSTLWRHTWKVILVSALAAAGGFFVSLNNPTYPTVPLILTLMTLLSILFRYV